MQTETRRSWIIPTVMIGVTLIGLAIFLRPKPQLIDRATRLADATNWQRDYSGYFWMPGRELLVQRVGTSAALSRINPATGQETPLTALNAQLRKHPPETISWRLSPDGKWLLALTQEEKNAYQFSAFALDGSRRITWPFPRENGRNILWMPDSRRWADFLLPRMGAPQPVLCDLNGKQLKTQPIKGPFTWPIGITPDERVLTAEQWFNQIDLYTYALSQKAVPVRKATVRFPKQMQIQEVEPSPTCDRIAYLTVSPAASPVQEVLQSALHRPRGRFTLWISRADGSGLHEVGVERDATVAGVQWTPDGTRLSIFIGKELYTIPAT